MKQPNFTTILHNFKAGFEIKETFKDFTVKDTDLFLKFLRKNESDVTVHNQIILV